MQNFMFYDCNLEGRQLEIGESGFYRLRKSWRYIFDAGFRKYGLNT